MTTNKREEKVCGNCKQPYRGGTLCPHTPFTNLTERLDREAREQMFYQYLQVAGYHKEFESHLHERDKEIIRFVINELESNPNEDGSISPNIQHWIERKQIQLRGYLDNKLK